MAWIPAATSVATSVIGALRKQKRANIGAINNRYMAMRPEGYLTDADKMQVARTAAAGGAAAARGGELGRGNARQQAVARGLSGASAAALIGRADQQEAANREAAAGVAQGQELSLQGNNRDFEREKMMTGWGNEVGNARFQNSQADAKESTFWNSVLESAPLIANAFAPTASPTGASIVNNAATYDPSLLSTANTGVKPRP